MSKVRVMVVDEHEGFRAKVSRLMAERGYETYPAADGIDALRQIYHVMPQLVVSDAGLPNLSGFEFLPFVKRRFPAIGVIALGCEPEEPVRRSRFVADAIVPRQPFDAEQLMKSAEEVISRYAFAPVTEEVDCA